MQDENLLIDTGDLAKYPSVELAYPIAVNSYETLSKRNDAIDTKTQNSLTFFITFFVAAVTLANMQALNFHSPFFVLSSVFIVIAAVCNLTSRIYGSLKTLNPMNFYEKYLFKTPLEFQKDFIYFAGQDYAHNNRMILIKWRWHLASIISFLIAVMLLVLWVPRPS